jgi:hypothetical protein
MYHKIRYVPTFTLDQLTGVCYKEHNIVFYMEH